jgi:hypothetical protein
LKNVTEHQVLPLATAVRGIRVVGQLALGNRTHAKMPRLPPEIMSLDDQRRLGSFAAKALERESGRLEETDTAPPEMSFPEYCDVARIHHLPCVHRMREHENQIPRIMIREGPNRWQQQELKRDVQVSHATGELSDSRTVQDPMGHWTFSRPTAQFESLFSSAARSPECRAILSDIEAPRPSDQSGIQALQDPRRILLPGRPEAYPSHRSPLSRQMGSRNRQQRDASGGQPK